MKHLLLSLTSALFLSSTASASFVNYTLTATGTPNEYTYLFTSNANLAQNQALVIRFPYSAVPPTYTNLENAIGGVGFNMVLHQPNNPPSANGDLTVLRTASGSAVATGFSVEATYSNNNPPSTLPFEIQQFDGLGNFQSTLETGTATLTGVPEPSSIMLSLAGTVMVGVYLAARRC